METQCTYTLLISFLGLVFLHSISARGVDTRDTYDLDAYIRTLKEQLDNLNSVRNKEPSTTQDDRVLSEATTNFLLREGALERRRLRNSEWLKDLCDEGCWWCCYIYKIITEKKPGKAEKAGNSSED